MTFRYRRRLSPPLILLLCTVVLLSLVIGNNRAKTVMAQDRSGYTLVIDPGHGGIDGGALGIEGSKESDINLMIALKMRAIAEFCGLDNCMTRQEDVTLSPEEAYSEHNDLVHRLSLATSETNSVLISIHQNSFPTTQASGAQVIYAISDASEYLGKLTHSNLISLLQPENRRVAEPTNGNIYILDHAEIPAILVECGFVSSFADIAKLTDSGYQCQLATVIIASYIQFTSVNTSRQV